MWYDFFIAIWLKLFWRTSWWAQWHFVVICLHICMHCSHSYSASSEFLHSPLVFIIWSEFWQWIIFFSLLLVFFLRQNSLQLWRVKIPSLQEVCKWTLNSHTLSNCVDLEKSFNFAKYHFLYVQRWVKNRNRNTIRYYKELYKHKSKLGPISDPDNGATYSDHV